MSTSSAGRDRAGRRLPSGRHGLSRADVASSQRRRIVTALFDALAEKGYPATTIGDVVERAVISRRTFYEHFTDKQACFLTAFDDAVAYVGARMGEVLETLPPDDWRDRIRQSWRVFLATLAERPNAAWSLYIESFSAGPALIDRTNTVNAAFAATFRELHRRARDRDAAIPELPPAVFDLYIGGTAERIRHRLHTRGADALPDLEDLFVDTMVILFGRKPDGTRSG